MEDHEEIEQLKALAIKVKILDFGIKSLCHHHLQATELNEFDAAFSDGELIDAFQEIGYKASRCIFAEKEIPFFSAHRVKLSCFPAGPCDPGHKKHKTCARVEFKDCSLDFLKRVLLLCDDALMLVFIFMEYANMPFAQHYKSRLETFTVRLNTLKDKYQAQLDGRVVV